MRIVHTCKCGASVVLEDDRGIYIQTGGAPDEKGRKFTIEVRADEWLEKHEGCLVVQEDSRNSP